MLFSFVKADTWFLDQLVMQHCCAGDIVPGPGAYSNAGRDLQHVFKPFTRIKAGFAAGTDRFKSSTKGAAPGPGAYDGVQASTLGKASFNVTYDDHKFNKLL